MEQLTLHVANLLNKVKCIDKWQKTFMSSLFLTWLSLRGSYTFTQLSSQGGMNESTYRRNFAKSFDFAKFNYELIIEHCSPNRIIVVDPSQISKSGTQTHGVGFFWSGAAGAMKKGLEILGIIIVDLDAHTGFHYVAVQTTWALAKEAEEKYLAEQERLAAIIAEEEAKLAKAAAKKKAADEKLKAQKAAQKAASKIKTPAANKNAKESKKKKEASKGQKKTPKVKKAKISKGGGALIVYYGNVIERYAVDLLKLSTYLVVDSFFAKKDFIERMNKLGFTVITRLRNDCVLKYPYLGEYSGSGRPRKYDGTVAVKAIRESFFTKHQIDKDTVWYEAELWVQSLGKLTTVIIQHDLADDGSIKKARVLVCADDKPLEHDLADDGAIKKARVLVCAYGKPLNGKDIGHYYHCRFQIEFLFRDGKQFSGLEDCQARSAEKLDFHFNASLTSVSLAKVAYYLPIPVEERNAFSMHNVKTQAANHLFLQKVFSTYGIDPNQAKNNPAYAELCNFGCVAA